MRLEVLDRRRVPMLGGWVGSSLRDHAVCQLHACTSGSREDEAGTQGEGQRRWRVHSLVPAAAIHAHLDLLLEKLELCRVGGVALERALDALPRRDRLPRVLLVIRDVAHEIVDGVVVRLPLVDLAPPRAMPGRGATRERQKGIMGALRGRWEWRG